MHRTLALLALSLVACADLPEARDGGAGISPARAPYSADASGSDSSDRSCTVVLRDVARLRNGTGGYEVHVVDGQRWIVWEGSLEVAESAVEDGAAPAVIFEDTAGDWWEVEATEAEGAGDGYQRYSFRLDEQTVTEGMSTSALSAARFELVPFVRTAAGDRLFDHNRNPGDFDNYVLDAADDWAVEDDALVCEPADERPESTLEFRSDWQQVQHGAMVPGGTVVVEYDPLRLSQCFGDTYMGQATWDIRAQGRFDPSGETFDASVVDCDDAACTQPQALPLALDVPADTTGVSVWFTTSGRSCGTAWDSDYGANYFFSAEPSPLDPAWVGDEGYTLSRGTDARADGIPDPLVVGSWELTRADHRSLDAEVYVPGVTDTGERSELILAQARVSRDGAEPERFWMDFEGRVGNNHRFSWDLGDVDMIYTPWDQFSVELAFSTDGLNWVSSGPWTIARGDDWCPETYWGSEWCP